MRGRHRLEEKSLWQAVEETKKDLDEAQKFFNEATNPLLVDKAISRLTAAEKKLSFLLNLARLSSSDDYKNK